MRIRPRLVPTALALVGLTSCSRAIVAPATASLRAARPDAIEITERGMLHVGVAEADITPPPGLAISDGTKSVGVGPRLRCAVFYFEYDAGDARPHEALAIAACDLGAPSSLLERLVAERVRRLTPLGADRVVVAASGAPGAPRIVPGTVDHEGVGGDALARFVADRIARAIAHAHDDAVRAGADAGCVAWSESSIRGHGAHRSPSFGRNAAVDAFAANRLSREEEAIFGASAVDAERATLGRVAVLRVDRCDESGKTSRPLGALALVDLSPAAMPATGDVYHPDVFGVAAREATAAFRDRERCPPTDEEGASCFVVGVAEGVAGDVIPNVTGRGSRETARLGEALGREIQRLHHEAEGSLLRDAPMRVAYRELTLAGALVEADTPFWRALRRDVYAPIGDGSRCGAPVALVSEGRKPTSCDPRLCATPEIGAVDDDPQGARLDPVSVDCQAPKVVRPRRFAEAPSELPRVAPLRVVYLGDRLLTTVPAEVSTLAGLRAARQLEAWLGSKGRADLGHVLTLSRASADVGAVTTEDEYAVQASGGARTLYGPSTSRFFADQELCLARWILEPLDLRSDAECALGQPDPGEMRALRVRGDEGTLPATRCAPEGDGRFVTSVTPDALAPLRGPPSSCGVDLRRVQRDGAEGFLARWIPPRACGSVAILPRVRVLDASDATREIDADDGAGIDERFVDGAWRITWVPGARARSRLLGRPFRLELSLEPLRPGARPHVERSEPFDPSCR